MGRVLFGVPLPDPGIPGINNPKPELDPHEATDLFTQTTETGSPVSIAYGTVKLSPNVIERASPVPLSGFVGPRQASTDYSTAGVLKSNAGSYYVLIKAGTTSSGSGPTGSGWNIADGTCAWAYVGPQVTQWQASTAYNVAGTVIYSTREQTPLERLSGTSTTEYYVLTTTGTSAATGGPTGQASDITDGTCHWCWVPPGHRQVTALGLCEGQIADVLRAWQDKQTYLVYTDIPHVSMTLLTGAASQARPTWATALSFTDTYNTTAVLFIDQGTGDSNSAPNVALEVKAPYGWTFSSQDTSQTDVSPVDIAIDLLTHARRGAGWSSSKIDSASTGSGTGSWRTYCSAAGIWLSWLIDTQRSALDLLTDLLTATSTDALWSGGTLKFLPRCDQFIGLYSPTVTPLYDLSPDDYSGPVEITRRRPADCFNSVPVQFVRRVDGAGNSVYKTDIIDNPDLADVDRRGVVVKGPTVALPFVMDPGVAVMLSRILVQASLNLRNTYTVRLPWRYMLLEPGDIVTLSDSRIRDDGSTDVILDHAPVRIVSWEETVGTDGTSEITIECQDYPAAAHHSAQYTPQSGDGYRPNSEVPVNGILAQPTSGVGANLLYGSDFSAGSPFDVDTNGGGWHLGHSTGSAWTGAIPGLTIMSGTPLGGNAHFYTLNEDTDPKNVSHDNTFMLYEPLRVGDGSAVDLYPTQRIPIDPAKRYAWSVYSGAYRCFISLYMAYYQADGTLSAIRATTLWPTSDAMNNAEVASGSTLDSFKRIFMLDAPPSDAAFCLPVVRKGDTVAGQTTSYMFLCRAQLEEVGPTAMVPGPWVPGPHTMMATGNQSMMLAGMAVIDGSSYFPASVSVSFLDAIGGGYTSEPDTSYVVTAMAVGSTGSPPVGAFSIAAVTKLTSGFEVHVADIVPAGSTVTLDITVIGARVARALDASTAYAL